MSVASSDTKLLVVVVSTVATALFCLACRWLARKQVERRIRALTRAHPEPSLPTPAVPASPRILTSSRWALPTLLVLVAILIPALIAQAAAHSRIGGWVAFVALFALVLVGTVTLAPSRADRQPRRKRR
jgi:sterol desaturase/sphingolipid hydroxylase (fatty acid hydroxylase superfamily)